MMFRKFNNVLALRLLVAVLLCSTLLSALATSVQLYIGFQQQDTALQEITRDIERGYGRSLSNALWSFDDKQVELVLNGVNAQADVAYVKLSNDAGRVWERGEIPSGHELRTGVIELVHPDPVNGETKVGTLELGLSRARIWSNFYAQILVVFLSNMAKTGLASIAILLIFYHLVSRHLRVIGDYVSESSWLMRDADLSLENGKPAEDDDLEAVVSAVNMTRRRFGDMHRDLSATTEQLRAVLDTAINGIIGLDHDGTVEVINPAARHMLGGRSEQTPFKWPEEIKFLHVLDLHPLDASADPVNRALAGQTLNGETHLMTSKNSKENRYVRVSSAVVDDPSNRLRSVVVLDDVSQLEKNRQQVERKGRLDALGQLTGGIAHDFNNLLATILYAMQLTRTDDISERSDRVLNTAIGAVERGRELTGRLLAFAKRQPGLTRSRSLAESFTEFEALARPTIEETVELTFVPPEPELLVHCDHGQLDNALLNLALNSRDAIMRSGKGSRIVVKARALDEVDADLALRRQDQQSYIAQGMRVEHARDQARADERAYRYVEISVTDDGPGMTEEVKMRAIDPFFTTKDSNSGTGLGLSMVYGFIQQSDGELRIYSELGFGTTIRLILPRGTIDNERERPMTRLPIQRGDGERILVVEDEDSLLMMMRELLTELGFTIVAATSGQEALDLVSGGEAFDLMLTDIVMPGGIGGFELAKRVREIRPNVPIVYMSGYTGFTSAEMGPVVAPLVQKPCPPAELAKVLTEQLIQFETAE